ncbi:TonB-dependent receptor plug domain-containing protein [Porticoccus hydrocarbonoclasticus]|uniref:TonB-dependent receptor plug domain-containing protein n=1 Tax=Porticoccus hydrocarbonoclasticus TaxID=1073414 RepID=UPI00055A70B7|nr:TonB-dependent receptor [Porticoccus hydrocarbonoclasticus]
MVPKQASLVGRRPASWLCCILLSLKWLPVLAASAEGYTEDDLIADIPVALSVTRLPQSVTDTSMAVSVIDRTMIEASGFIEIPDLLRLVPGFQVGLSWRDHHASVTYHGQSDGLSRRMQVLLDGRVVVGSLFGLVDWDRLGITVDDIERIEVVRGPAGVSFGSNAFVGVINIVTQKPYRNPGWRFSATTGSRDTSLLTARYAHSGDQFDYRASLSYFNTEGFHSVNDESIARSGRFQGTFQATPETSLDFQLGYAEGPWGRGGSGVSVDPVGTKEASEQYGSIRLTRTTDPGSAWYLQFGFTSGEENDKFSAGLLSDLLGVDPADIGGVIPGQQEQEVFGRTFDYQVNRRDIEFQQLLNGQRYRIAWGLGYRKDMVNSLEIVGQKEWQAMETFRTQGNIEYRLTDQLLLNAGAIYEKNNISSGELSWRLGLNFTPTKGHMFRLSVAESWRQPFLVENFHNIAVRLNDGTAIETVQVAPEPIDPERLRSYELGYIGNWLDERLTAEIKLYRETFEDEIEYVWDPAYPEVASIFNQGAILDVNGGSTAIEGFETGARWLASDRTRFWLSYAYADADQSSLPMAFRSLYQTSATPRHTASLLMSHDLGRHWQVSAGYYYLDDMVWILWGSETDAYRRLDVRIARQFPLRNADLKLELIGQNLGGDYVEFKQANRFETRTFLRATLQFH